MKTSAASGFAVAVLAAACQRGEGSAVQTTSAAPAASQNPSSDRAPSYKTTTATPPERVGTLPAGLGLPVGQKAPDAHALDLDGRDVSLAALAKDHEVLIVFYRGGWCPYCNFEIHELSTHFPDFQRRGVTPVAVSADKPDEAAKTQRTHAIPFPVLSDPDLHVQEAFHVIHHADDAEAARLKGFGIDLEKSSGRDHHSFAIPALFLVDRDGIVRWAHADPDYKVRPSVAQMLAAVDAVHQGGAR